MRVLVVEDEIKMASLIRRGLRSEGLAADVAIKGEDALWMAGSTGYDTIVPLAKLEPTYLPTPERIAAAARETLEAA